MNYRRDGLRCTLLGVALGLVVAAAAAADPMEPTPCARHGRILVIRGLFNVFSLGLDDLACQLSQLGYQVDVTPVSLADVAAWHIQQDYLRDPSTGPLVIIGHSKGGALCCSLPWKWREANIPVKLVVILDTNPWIQVADNVERCVNLYVTNDLGIFHGRPVAIDSPQTNLVNIDVTKLPRPPGVPPVNHFNIDDSRWIHSLVVAEVDRTLCPCSDNREPWWLHTEEPHVPFSVTPGSPSLTPLSWLSRLPVQTARPVSIRTAGRRPATAQALDAAARR